MTVVMKHCDDQGMEHGNEKTMETFDEKSHGAFC